MIEQFINKLTDTFVGYLVLALVLAIIVLFMSWAIAWIGSWLPWPDGFRVPPHRPS